MTNTTERRTAEFRIVGKCKRCKRVSSAVATRVTTTSTTTGMYPHRSVVETWPSAVVCCGLQVGRVPVIGRRTEAKCDERCTTATGHKCECSCNGKNHGADHG